MPGPADGVRRDTSYPQCNRSGPLRRQGSEMKVTEAILDVLLVVVKIVLGFLLLALIAPRENIALPGQPRLFVVA